MHQTTDHAPARQAGGRLLLLLLVVLALLACHRGAAAQSIDNTAHASWTYRGLAGQAASNTVTIEIERTPARIVTFARVPLGGSPVTFTQSVCASETGAANNGTTSAQVITANIAPAGSYRPGDAIFFEIDAPAGNRDAGVIDHLSIVFESSSGDREVIRVGETGSNTGRFFGSIASSRPSSATSQGDCRLEVTAGDIVSMALLGDDAPGLAANGDVVILADPFGIAFDSETGAPVNGAVVRLVDATTGQPAQVFAEDGITSWPSTVVTGQPVTDGAGNVYPIAAGEYWFPLTFEGRYRIDIAPPSPYSAPSSATPAMLERLTRADGRAFVVTDASFGASFALAGPAAVQIDVPLDRPAAALELVMSASRAQVQPGDVVIFTVVPRNPDTARPRRDVTISVEPSPGLRIRTDTIRIDGAPANGAATVSADGRTISIALGDMPGNSSQRISYAAVVRADASPGQLLSTARSSDGLGRTASASAAITVERDTIADRMSIVGQVLSGNCLVPGNRAGLAGIRVMMQDGSFAVTDADGRFHFEGVVPGTYVLQVARSTLPQGATLVDCTRSTRSAGSAASRFVTGQGGSLARVDFHVMLVEAEQSHVGRPAGASLETVGEPAAPSPAAVAGGTVRPDSPASEWLALGDGPDGWLTPAEDHNPRVPAVRVAFRHRTGQTINLYVDGQPVSALAFDGTFPSADRAYSVSLWRGIPLQDGRTVLAAEIINSMGGINARLERTVHFVSEPANVELVADQSVLVADGVTAPVVVVRLTDRDGRPVREGIAGEFLLGAPFESADQIEQRQLRQLSGIGEASARWVVEGDQGLARIELAPTMVSGLLRMEFILGGENIRRRQEIEAWVVPGDTEWTIVGLAEASIGARTVADNMERSTDFESDLGSNARMAIYAKGRILGRYLVTLAYDSASQREDQRVLAAIDPQAYYTVFADNSSRRFDAPTRENLYVRIETSTFLALYGDFQTGFDETRLARYQRTATGVRAQARVGTITAQAFGALIGTGFRREEFQGSGLAGPYQLAARDIVANSERVRIETRDRFRSDVIVSARSLAPFIDYRIDLLSGTITFNEPVMSRDFDLNPQFVVIEYEAGEAGDGELNAGLRARWSSEETGLQIGATALSDQGDALRTNIGAIDVRLGINGSTELRSELALSESGGQQAAAWLVEAQHQSGRLDAIVYGRSSSQDFGAGHHDGVESGRRKVGIDARYELGESLTVFASGWQDDSLIDSSRRRAAQLQLGYRSNTTDLRLGLFQFSDQFADGGGETSTLLETGATRRLLGNRLELSVASSIALDNPSANAMPPRHRLGLRYTLSRDVRLVGTHEIADSGLAKARTSRAGVEIAPWRGGRIVTSLGQQASANAVTSPFAGFGFAQTLAVTPTLSIDATLDGNRVLGARSHAPEGVNVPPAGLAGEVLEEDFTAVTLGGTWRQGQWSATGRGEYRDGHLADRKGLTLGLFRQLGDGRAVGGRLVWTRSTGVGGTATEVREAALTIAHRPHGSPLSVLGRLEYRSDSVTGAVAGEAGPTGRTALAVDGDGVSRRLIASLSTNWAPQGRDSGGQGVQRTEIGLFLGTRYSFESVEGLAIGGLTALAGLDLRIGLSDRVDIGATANLRANVTDGAYSYTYGPQASVVVSEGVILTMGYNIEGFRDPDFSGTRNLDRGFFAAVRAKF
jgi:hypothetical protein